MSTVRVYKASDPGAPKLTGVAGSLIDVLDGCLINGYGSGANAKTAAGWTKSFSATNRGAYRQAAGNQFYYDVDDRGASGVLTGASGQEAAIRGYEAMTALSTGTNPFPTTGQSATATANIRKSATADAHQREWLLVADDRTFYLVVNAGDGNPTQTYWIHTFGDFYSFTASDGYRCHINVRTAANGLNATGTLFSSVSTGVTSTSSGYNIPRIAAGTGTSVIGGYIMLGTGLEVTMSYYASPDQKAYLERVLIVQGNTSPYIRGYMRGLWLFHPSQGLDSGTIITGSGELTGRTFVVLSHLLGSLVTFALETSSTWDTSS